MSTPAAADLIRRRLGAAIFQRVAGPQGPARRRVINDAAGERWFAEDRPIRRVHGDSSMFIGGITALLLQSLHPLAMAAVAANSRCPAVIVGVDQKMIKNPAISGCRIRR